MDGKQFDGWTKRFSMRSNRRSVVKGLLASGAAVAVARTGNAFAAGAKVTICHYPPDNPGNVRIISVGASALPDHFVHGDQYYCASGSATCVDGNECCDDSQCSDLTDDCNTGACSNGFCQAAPISECKVGCFNTECCGDGDCSDLTDDCHNGACNNGSCDAVLNGMCEHCDSAVLAGDASGGSSIYIDDDLTVIFKGNTIYADPTNAPSGFRGPFELGSTAYGDALEVLGSNSPSYCGNRSIGPLYLVCLDNGKSQFLDGGASASFEGFPCTSTPFYDQTFTVALWD